MIKECILCDTGIQFDLDYLRDELDFDFGDLLEEMTKKNIKIDEKLKECAREDAVHPPINKSAPSSTAPLPEHETLRQRFRRHATDLLDEIFDQLVRVWWFWWILEMIPMLYTYQDQKGDWIRQRM